MPAAVGIGQAAGQQQAQVLLGREDRQRLLVASGAMTTSVKIFTRSRLARPWPVERRFTATMPPKAETGSQASAFW
jgi:hypothetical protein